MKPHHSLSWLFQAAFIALLAGIATTGCDQINGPYKDVSPVQNPDTSQNVAVRKVLLQEFTGHKCGNCPAAAEKAHELKQIYGEKLIVMSVHAGWFAETQPASSGKYTFDFTTPEGTTLDDAYNTAGAYPSAVINRAKDKTFNTTEWASVIDTMVSKPAQAKITISPAITQGTRELKITVKTKFMQAVNNPQNLTVYLTESEKISWQKDYRLPTSPPGAQDIPDYSHNHFLRATLTPVWGETLTNGPAAANQEITKEYTYQVPNGFNLAKLTVIAAISDKQNNRVMQAEESGYLQ